MDRNGCADTEILSEALSYHQYSAGTYACGVYHQHIEMTEVFGMNGNITKMYQNGMVTFNAHLAPVNHFAQVHIIIMAHAGIRAYPFETE